MIVKNEEDTISRCLKSVEGVVDELIIVDTGSTDKTVDIARSFGAKVYPFAWNDHFSDARNFGIEKAKGDWILWLDADEELERADQKKLKEGKHFDCFDVLSLQLINYYGNHIDPNRSTNIGHTRLFRNSGLQFVNSMHERLDLSNVQEKKIGELDVRIHHYGYLTPIVRSKNKSERNKRMLNQQITIGEEVYWAHYYLALEAYNEQQYEEALQHVNQSLLAFLGKGVLPPSMVYKLKYSILIARGDFKEARKGIDKAILLYRDYVDLHFFKGIILYYLEEPEKAIRSFKRCLEIGESNSNHLILKGVGTFQALTYIGKCQIKLKTKRAAAVSFMKALLLAPQYSEALTLLMEIVNEGGLNLDHVITKHFEEKDQLKLKQIVEGKAVN